MEPYIFPHLILELWRQADSPYPPANFLEARFWPINTRDRSVVTSPFPDTYLVLMAQTTLDEWFGLYSSNTREIEMFAFKWSQRLHSSTSESRDEGGGKKIEKASSMLVWTGSTEKSVSLPRQPPPAAQQRDSGSQAAQGSPPGEMKCMG